jgi:putative transcriptional regulator
MPTKQQYLDDVRDVLHSSAREHTTAFEQEYCFDGIVDEGATRIAIKISLTIDNVEAHALEELSRICPILKCTPLIIGERTRKRDLQNGVVHTRGSIPAITLETLRRLLEERILPLIVAKKGGIYAIVNGQKLKEAREALHFSRGDVADEMGLSRRAIYEYERGTINPTIDVALRLEKLLKANLIEPINPLKLDSVSETSGTTSEIVGKQTQLAKKALEILSRLGFQSTLTNETPFDMLTSLRKQVLLSYLKHPLERFDEERLIFLANLADVLDEEPAIITSDRSSVETINGIPVVYLKELLAIENPKEFITLIRNRRGA